MGCIKCISKSLVHYFGYSASVAGSVQPIQCKGMKHTFLECILKITEVWLIRCENVWDEMREDGTRQCHPRVWHNITCGITQNGIHWQELRWYIFVSHNLMQPRILGCRILCTCFCMISLISLYTIYSVQCTCSTCWGNAKHKQINRDFLASTMWDDTVYLKCFWIATEMCSGLICCRTAPYHSIHHTSSTPSKTLSYVTLTTARPCKNPQKQLTHLTDASLNRSCKDLLDRIAYHA